MIVVTQNDVTLYSVQHKTFKGRDGSDVNYFEAKLGDDEGNVFKCSVVREMGDDFTSIEKLSGVATFDVGVASYGGKDQVKLKLVGFTPVSS